MDLYNWYENRFPNDFKQLMKIKRYNISDLSFLLAKIWRNLDYGEKLLMCAVYYDDFTLARQMLNESVMFRVNPFYGKRYFTKTPHHRTIVSTSESLAAAATCVAINSPPSSPSSSSSAADQASSSSSGQHHQQRNSNHIRRTTLTSTSEAAAAAAATTTSTCWCLNHSFAHARCSLSTLSDNDMDTDHNTDNDSEDDDDEDEDEDEAIAARRRQRRLAAANRAAQHVPTPPATTYYFNQVVYEFHMHTPFYFAVKLNKLKMCQLFVDNLKAVYLTKLNHHNSSTSNSSSSSTTQQSIRNHHQQYAALPRRTQAEHSVFYQQHRACIANYLSKRNIRVFMNALVADDELAKLLVLALSNRAYDIATLILANVSNPRKILRFGNLSESFIYNKEFCLFLVVARIVDARIMLKEATQRHSAAVAIHIIDHLEHLQQQQEQQQQQQQKSSALMAQLPPLVDIYKHVLRCAIGMRELTTFRHVLHKLTDATDASLWAELTVEKMINARRGGGIGSGATRSTTQRTRTARLLASIDAEATRALATERGFDCHAYFTHDELKPLEICSGYVSPLTRANRVALVAYLFDGESDEAKTSVWMRLGETLNARLVSYDTFFAPDPTSSSKQHEQQPQQQAPTRPRIYIGNYLITSESEPFLISAMFEHRRRVAAADYTLTASDLISAAKSASSELTLYYLLLNVSDFASRESRHLLDDLDDSGRRIGSAGGGGGGNFLEILFCRMCRSGDHEQTKRLQMLFFEAVVVKGAQMTCGTHMLELVTAHQDTASMHGQVYAKYLPCLFYLSKSFGVFRTSEDARRFDMLVEWLVRHVYWKSGSSLGGALLMPLSKEQIEAVVHDYVRRRCESSWSAVKPTKIKLELSLKEMARRSFLDVYRSMGATSPVARHATFVNSISRTARHYILGFDEIKHLCS